MKKSDQQDLRGERAPAGRAQHSKSEAKTVALPPQPKTASLLVGLIQKEADTFVADDDVYATMTVRNHKETFLLSSKRFKGFIAQRMYSQLGKTIGENAMAEAIRVVEASTFETGERQSVHVRLGQGEDGTIYVDLADDGYHAIQTTPDGWKVVTDPPVCFLRRGGMRPLSLPEGDGVISDLKRFLNVEENDFPLVCAWLINCFHPSGPYPILQLHGEQGSAKTTMSLMLRSLVDPNLAPLRVMPQTIQDLAIAAASSSLLAYDNLSFIRPELSDALCRLATGGGFATRRLYTDDEEVIFQACRPILINGIEELGNRADLLDRMIMITLPSIDRRHRRDEEALWEEFECEEPLLFGAILDGVVLALRNHRNVNPPTLGRMADFERWAIAASPLFGGAEIFRAAYRTNITRMNALALESTPIVEALQHLLKEHHGRWRGNSLQLLEELNRLESWSSSASGIGRGRSWPKSPRGMSGLLRRSTPSLRAIGIHVGFNDRGRRWDIYADGISMRNKRSGIKLRQTGQLD